MYLVCYFEAIVVLNELTFFHEKTSTETTTSTIVDELNLF